MQADPNAVVYDRDDPAAVTRRSEKLAAAASDTPIYRPSAASTAARGTKRKPAAPTSAGGTKASTAAPSKGKDKSSKRSGAARASSSAKRAKVISDADDTSDSETFVTDDVRNLAAHCVLLPPPHF